MPVDATIGLAAYSALLNWVTTDQVGIAWLHAEWGLVLTEYRQLRKLLRQGEDNFACNLWKSKINLKENLREI